MKGFEEGFWLRNGLVKEEWKWVKKSSGPQGVIVKGILSY